MAQHHLLSAGPRRREPETRDPRAIVADLVDAPNPHVKQYLMTAGPTPLPPRVLSVMAEPVVYHRAPAFDALLARVLDRLPAVFGTSNDVMIFASSGSGPMGAAGGKPRAPGQK